MLWIYDRIALWVVLVLSLTVHEWAHAWQADRLGDDTARLQGRMSLHPFAHLDPIGSVALPLLGVPFGWAKPVPVEPRRFDGRVSMARGLAMAALAGPVSNMLLAALCWSLSVVGAGMLGPAGETFLGRMVQVNVALAVFNLLPIPPLDGSRIVDGLMPDGLRSLWDRVVKVAPPVLVVVVAAAWALWSAAG
jgi:Zn-dependent protease